MDSSGSDTGQIIFLEDDFHCFNIKKELDAYPNDMIDRINDKMIEIVENDAFKFKTIILKLILSHEYTFENKHENAFKYLEELENEVNLLVENDCDDKLFKKINKALLNVVRTCKMYVLISQNDDEKARKIMPSIIPFADLDTCQKAGVFGIRSMIFIEYGLHGHKMALEYAKKANQIDKDNPYWYFLIGKSMGRIRRVEKPYDIPSDEERNALETAINMESNYLFMLFTAEVYVETSGKTYRFHVRNRNLYPTLKVQIDRLNEKACNIYRKCIELQPKCSHVLFRSARGFLNLPYPQKDPERAKELLLQGLQSNPRNPFANHLLARYYERYGSDIPKAIERLKICREHRVFGAEMDLLRMQYAKEGNNGVVDRLYELLNIYAEAPRKLQIMTQLASFYIFINSDIPKACKLMKEAITMNCDDNIINHRSLFLRVREPFNILDVLVDEMKLQMAKNCDEEKKKLYESFIFDMNDSNIQIPKGRAKNLKTEILKEDKEARLGNYYRRDRNTFGRSQMQRRSYPKPVQKSDKEISMEKSHTMKQVEDFFDSYIDDAIKEETKPYNESKYKNNSSRNSLNGSVSDLSPTSDSRYSSTRGRYNGNRNFDRYSKEGTNLEDTEFDTLSLSSTGSHDRSNFSRFKNYNNNNSADHLEKEFDRLSVSSRNSDSRSGFSNFNRGRGSSNSCPRQFQERGDTRSGYSNPNRGRGSSNSHSRQFHERGDSFGRGRERNFNTGSSYDNTANKDSKFSRGRGGSSNGTVRQSQNARSSTFKSWRKDNVPQDRSHDETADSHVSKDDSDDDLMSYFKKK